MPGPGQPRAPQETPTPQGAGSSRDQQDLVEYNKLTDILNEMEDLKAYLMQALKQQTQLDQPLCSRT